MMALDIYSNQELGKQLVAFQEGIDKCVPGSSVHSFYCEMVRGIATELLNRYRQETVLLDRCAEHGMLDLNPCH